MDVLVLPRYDVATDWSLLSLWCVGSDGCGVITVIAMLCFEDDLGVSHLL